MGSLAREQVQNSFHSFRFPVMTQQLSIGTVCPTGLGMCPPRGGLSQCPTPAPPAAQSQVRPPPSCQAPTLRAWPPSRPTPARPPADLPRDLALGRGACLPQALPPVPPWGERGAGGGTAAVGFWGSPLDRGPARPALAASRAALWSPPSGAGGAASPCPLGRRGRRCTPGGRLAGVSGRAGTGPRGSGKEIPEGHVDGGPSGVCMPTPGAARASHCVCTCGRVAARALSLADQPLGRPPPGPEHPGTGSQWECGVFRDELDRSCRCPL